MRVEKISTSGWLKKVFLYLFNKADIVFENESSKDLWISMMSDEDSSNPYLPYYIGCFGADGIVKFIVPKKDRMDVSLLRLNKQPGFEDETLRIFKAIPGFRYVIDDSDLVPQSQYDPYRYCGSL